MAVPKKRHNSSRTRRRRNHQTHARTALQKCPSCSEMAQPHRVCTHCGTYRDRQYKEIVTTV